jgi:hypothetical protein
MLAPLPVVFIPFRGFFVMYLPLAGWAMCAATVLVRGRDRILARIWDGRYDSANAFGTKRVVLFVVVAVLVFRVPHRDRASDPVSHDPGQPIISQMARDIRELDEPLPKGAMVLFLHDRFPADAWGTLMLSRLLYRDRDLWADRPTMMTAAPNLPDYDRVFDYVGGTLCVVRTRPAMGGVRPMLKPR